MHYFYDPASDSFGQGDIVPKGSIELDPVRAQMFALAESRGHRIDRSTIDSYRLSQTAQADAIVAARRARRDQLLLASDWTQLPDAWGGDSSKRPAWIAYRQELRDLDMTQDTWPTPPSDEAVA